MVESNATWGDLIAHRGGPRFVGRRDELELFRLSFLYDVPAALLFVIQGPPGSGKTALLAQFGRIAREMGAVAVHLRVWEIASGGDGAALEAMAQLQAQLQALGMPLVTFRERYQEYVQLLERIAHDPMAPGPPWALLGGVSDPDPWAQQAWDAYLDRTFPGRLALLLRDPLGVLTDRFVSDLNAWAAVRKIVLTVDDWDTLDSDQRTQAVAGNGLGEWFADLLTEGALSSNISVTLATRTSPGSQFQALHPVMALIHLDPLTPMEAAHLSPGGIRDIATSPGSDYYYPLHLLLASITGAEPEDTLDELVARYLKGLSAEQQIALLHCAVSHACNMEELSAVCREIEVESLREWLTEIPWVEREEGGWRLQRAFRERVLAYGRQYSPDLWREAHLAWYGLLRGEGEGEIGGALCLQDLDRLRRQRKALACGLAVCEPDAVNLAMHELLAGLTYCLPWALAVADTWVAAARSGMESCELLVSLMPDVIALVRAAVRRDYSAAIEALAGLSEHMSWPTELVQQLRNLGQQMQARIPAVVASVEEVENAVPVARATTVEPPQAAAGGSVDEDEMVVTEAMREEAIAICRQGDEHLRARAYQAALEQYDRALALDPACLPAYLNRARVLLRLGALDQAIADLNQVLALDATHAQALWQRGLAHARKGDLTQAIADYSAALAQDQTLVVARFDRGGAFFRIGDYRRAVEDYTAVIEQRPGWATAYLNRGRVYVEQGRFPEALRDYSQAISLAPDRGDIYRYRAQALAEMGRYSDALADYERALERDPQDAVAYNGRGLTYLRIQAYPEAIAAFKRAMALRPDWAAPYYNGACAAALQGDEDQACLWLVRAIELRPAYRRQALSDPDFTAVRESACFVRLVQSLGDPDEPAVA